ncbi:MAG: hypothetical protein RR847_02310 [Bacilli bacterium]
MNVIVANKYETMLKTLNIELIKSITGEFEASEIVETFQKFFFQRMVLDITAIKNYTDIKNIQTLSISLDMDKVILLLDNSPESSSNIYLSKLISIGIYNFAKNLEEVKYLLQYPNSYRDVAHIHQLGNEENEIQMKQNLVSTVQQSKRSRIIGFKNVTKQTGASTLIYMLKKQLQKRYSVLAIEVNKHDFMYFKEKDMISVTDTDLKSFLDKNDLKNIILVDVNDTVSALEVCDDIIYLIEPSIVKLHKMLFVNPEVLKSLYDKKVVLNQSLLSNKDVLDFSNEALVKIFFNIPPLDERQRDFPILEEFIIKLGL